VYRTPLRDTRVTIIGLTGRVPSTSSVPGLPLVDAVELAAAWAAALAERLGIRLLVIKGDTLARHRLRDRRLGDRHAARLARAVGRTQGADLHGA
jgi:hypothetical protein